MTTEDMIRRTVRAVLREHNSKPLSYTIETASQATGRTKYALLGAIQRGELKAVRRGKAYMIPAAALAKWAGCDG